MRARLGVLHRTIRSEQERYLGTRIESLKTVNDTRGMYQLAQ